MIIQSVSQITSISRPRTLILLEIILDNYLYYLKTKRLVVECLLVKRVLTVTYIAISRFLRWYYRTEITVSKKLLNIEKDRFIIVANHRKAIDPYLILITLPFDVFRTLLPIRFFTANVFLKYWWQRCFFLPFGCFRAYSTEGKVSGVKGALQLSDQGQSLFIFPEGKRVRNTKKVELKVGVTYLAQRRNFTIIPVNISYNRSSSKKKTQIIWGAPFKYISNAQYENFNVITRKIFRKVQVLSAQK